MGIWKNFEQQFIRAEWPSSCPVARRDPQPSPAGALRAGLGRTTHMIWGASVDEPRKSRKELLDEIATDRMPPPMIGDSVERSWAKAMGRFVDEKVAGARKPGYAAHDEQWLLIYDNWPAPALQRQLAVTLLQENHLKAVAFDVFKRVFILDEAVLVELRRACVLLHSVNHSMPASPVSRTLRPALPRRSRQRRCRLPGAAGIW